MKNIIIFFFCICVLNNIQSQEVNPEVLEAFEAQTFVTPEGDSLHYRIMIPERMKEGEKLPLIIFLHGLGERGVDNKIQLVHGGEFFLNGRDSFPAIVVFPQCPLDTYWNTLEYGGPGTAMKFPFYEQPSKGLGMAMSMADHLVENHPIDTSRQYLMGLSMGGFGTFDWLAREPHRFAAATPICGGANPLLAPIYAPHTRLWIFHGDADSIVPVSNSRKMVDAAMKAGGKVKYTEYPGVGHNSWDNAFAEPGLLSWLLKK